MGLPAGSAAIHPLRFTAMPAKPAELLYVLATRAEADAGRAQAKRRFRVPGRSPPGQARSRRPATPSVSRLESSARNAAGSVAGRARRGTALAGSIGSSAGRAVISCHRRRAHQTACHPRAAPPVMRRLSVAIMRRLSVATQRRLSVATLAAAAVTTWRCPRERRELGAPLYRRASLGDPP